MSALITMIPYVDAIHFPTEVENWCIDNDIKTHYDNDVACIEDDGNPFAEWLKSLGVVFPEKGWVSVAIAGT